MKRLFIMANIASADNLKLEDITGGKLRATYLSAVTPLSDGESYARIGDNGRTVVCHSFRTGRQTGVLFDVDNNLAHIPPFVHGCLLHI